MMRGIANPPLMPLLQTWSMRSVEAREIRVRFPGEAPQNIPRWRNGSASGSYPGGWRFESSSGDYGPASAWVCCGTVYAMWEGSIPFRVAKEGIRLDEELVSKTSAD